MSSAPARPWSFVVLPDTQIYAASHPELFRAQTRWIAEQAEALDIRFVLHEGDVVHDNTDAQWRVAREALRELDGRVPYVVAPGNHDLGEGGSAADRRTGLDQWLADAEIERRPSFGGAFEPGRLSSTWHLFETPDGPWLVIALEFAPRGAVLEWADRVLGRHAGVPSILLTHAYLYSDGTRYDRRARPEQRWSPHVYGVASDGDAADGEAIWQRLVRRHDHLGFVFCGHVLNEGVAYLRSVQEGGGVVHQLLANYQHRERGGNGFLRLVRIDSSAATARIRTYSPAVDAYRRGPAEELDLPLRDG